MKIERRKQSNAVQTICPVSEPRHEAGQALTQLLGSGFFFGLAIVAFSSAFAAVFCVVQFARQDLRASRLVMQRAESLSLFTGSQLSEAEASGKPLLIEDGTPTGFLESLGGPQDAGYLTSAVSAGGDLAPASRGCMRSVTLSLRGRVGGGEDSSAHTSQIQIGLARNGAPKYVWPAF